MKTIKKTRKLKKLKKSKKRPKELQLLTRGDTVQLYKFKRKAKMGKAGKALISQFDNPAWFFDNLITVEELAVIFGLAPRTIRNWIARREIPHVKIGRRNFLQKRSVQKWLNQKEEPRWQ